MSIKVISLTLDLLLIRPQIILTAERTRSVVTATTTSIVTASATTAHASSMTRVSSASKANPVGIHFFKIDCHILNGLLNTLHLHLNIAEAIGHIRRGLLRGSTGSIEADLLLEDGPTWGRRRSYLRRYQYGSRTFAIKIEVVNIDGIESSA